MAGFVSVLKASDLTPGAMKMISLDGVEIVVANVDGKLCAFGNICPHEGGPLVDGELDGDAVTCPWHFTRFSVHTGEVVEGVTDEPIPVYAVRVEGDEVQVASPGGA